MPSVSTNDFVSVNAWWVNWDQDKNSNNIDDVLEDPSQNSSEVSIFLHYHYSPTDEDINLLLQYHLPIAYRAKCINTVSIHNVSRNLLPFLANLPNVVMVENQPFIHSHLDTSTRGVKARESTLYSPNTAWELGYTGKNVVVAVLDTGVDDEHAFLNGKFVAGFDCSGPSADSDREINPDDLDGHGTHVASIIMGTGGSEGIYKGVAPDAKLVDVKVIRDIGNSYSDQLIRGIDWVIQNKDRFNISIINLSVGYDVEDYDGTSAPSRAANMAVENGILLIAAAGNEGPDTVTLTAPSIADKVICVTAINDMNTINRDDDAIASYSSRGPRGDETPKPDLAAPGSGIIGAKAVQTGNASNEIISMSGTSMAAPHVSGVAALILQSSPQLSPLEIKQILLNATEDKGEAGWDVEYGWGEIEAHKAFALIHNLSLPEGPLPLNPRMVVRSILSYLLSTGWRILYPGGVLVIMMIVIMIVVDIGLRRKHRVR